MTAQAPLPMTLQPKQLGDLSPSPKLVSSVAQLVLATTALSMVAFPFVVPVDDLLMPLTGSGAFALIYIGVWILAQRGRPTAGAWLFVAGTWVGQVGVIWSTGALTEQALVSVVNITLATGFMLGRRPALMISLICTTTIVSLSWLGSLGLLPPPSIAVSDEIHYVSLICVLITSAGLTYIGVEFMMSAVSAADVSALRATEAMVALEMAREEDGRRVNRAERLGIMARNLVGQVEPSAFTTEVAIGLRDALDALVVLIVGRGGRVHASAGLGDHEPPSDVLQESWDQLISPGTYCLLNEASLAQIKKELGLEGPTLGMAGKGPQTAMTVVVLGREGWLVPSQVQWPIQASANLLDAAMIRFESEARMVQAQKMDALGRLSAGIAHDFNNLLTTILGGTELLEHRADAADPIQDHLRRIREAGARAASLTSKLMTFTRGAPHTRQLVEVTALVSDLLPILRRTLEESIQIEHHESEQVSWVDADPIDLERIILNLVANARDAMGTSGRIDIGLEVRAPITGGKRVTVLWVQDDGEGMDLEVRTRVFEPFFTTRRGKGATGLGLSIVYGVAQAIGGDVFIDSAKGAGTCVEVHLPTLAEPREDQAQMRPLTAPSSGSRVLVVEDDPDVRDTICEMLALGGYSATAVPNGIEAIQCLDQDQSYCLVLSDVVMPSMSGFELAREMVERNIETPIALISGYAPGGGECEDEATPRALITKPFSLDELLGFVSTHAVMPGELEQVN